MLHWSSVVALIIPAIALPACSIQTVQRPGRQLTASRYLSPPAIRTEASEIDAAERGNRHAAARLALCYRYGCPSNGIAANQDKMLYWDRKWRTLRGEEVGQTAEAPSPATLKWGSLIDQVVKNDSTTWTMNHYVPGTIRNAQIIAGAEGSRALTVQADYNYTDGSDRRPRQGWVALKLQNGEPYCITYWDFPNDCRRPGAANSFVRTMREQNQASRVNGRPSINGQTLGGGAGDGIGGIFQHAGNAAILSQHAAEAAEDGDYESARKFQSDANSEHIKGTLGALLGDD